MGTGIVATAGATLPVRIPGTACLLRLRSGSSPSVLLVVLIIAVTAQWVRHPTVARSHAHNPQMAHFYGAAPMALLTVGSGALLSARISSANASAVDLEWVLWTVGTIGGLFTAMSIPYLMFTQINVDPDAAFGGWLMPVVPPMVSAATGALLIPHMARALDERQCSMAATRCSGCPGRRADHHHHDLEPARATTAPRAPRGLPTLWIVLGPLGQGITAAGLLGANAALGRAARNWPAAWRFRGPLRGAGVGLRGAVDRVGHRS